MHASSSSSRRTRLRRIRQPNRLQRYPRNPNQRISRRLIRHRRKPPMAAVDTVFEQLGTMTVLELVELKNKIEEEWGITAAAPVAVAAAGPAAGDGAAAVEEKTSFDVVLTGAGAQKIQVI